MTTQRLDFRQPYDTGAHRLFSPSVGTIKHSLAGALAVQQHIMTERQVSTKPLRGGGHRMVAATVHNTHKQHPADYYGMSI